MTSAAGPCPRGGPLLSAQRRLRECAAGAVVECVVGDRGRRPGAVGWWVLDKSSPLLHVPPRVHPVSDGQGGNTAWLMAKDTLYRVDLQTGKGAEVAKMAGVTASCVPDGDYICSRRKSGGVRRALVATRQSHRLHELQGPACGTRAFMNSISGSGSSTFGTRTRSPPEGPFEGSRPGGTGTPFPSRSLGKGPGPLCNRGSGYR